MTTQEAPVVYIYEGTTGKFKRRQVCDIDALETQKTGETVYFTYANSTNVVPPEIGEHEALYFIDGEWEVRGNYKNLEVYDKTTKSFTYCNTDELGENQVYIDDPQGIQNFRNNYGMYMVNNNNEIVLNPLYNLQQEIRALESAINQADITYNEALEAPVVFPGNGKHYKAKWIDDGTYTKLITGKMAGLIQFPQDIWDATKLEENKVSMDEQTFGALCAFLANVQYTAFEARKYAQSELLTQKAEKEEELEALKEELGLDD